MPIATQQLLLILPNAGAKAAGAGFKYRRRGLIQSMAGPTMRRAAKPSVLI